MANLVKHSAVSGINLHDLKGVASAADDTVVTASSGASVWQKATVDNMVASATAFNSQLFHTRYQESTGVKPARYKPDFTTDDFLKFPLNTTLTNEISGASLASNQLTLPSGTYLAKFDNGINGDIGSFGRVKLRNVTSNLDLVLGSSYLKICSCMSSAGFFTLASTSLVELWLSQSHLRTSSAFTYLGSLEFDTPLNIGIDNVYADLLIWKLS